MALQWPDNTVAKNSEVRVRPKMETIPGMVTKKNNDTPNLKGRMPHRKKKHGKRKKVIRKDGKRYYRAGKSGLVRLKGGKKPPHRRH